MRSNKVRNNELISNNDVQVTYGLSYYEAKKVIRRVKLKLVKSGFDYYDNCRVGKVPHSWIREDLGLSELED